jgi:hypothetical protein
VLLIAIAGEALNPDELAVFKALANRQKAPAEPVAEFGAGRRGGKSRSMAVLGAWLGACKDYRSILAPGERGQLQVLSATRDQAGNLFNFITGIFEASRALRGLVENKTADTLCLKCHISIVVCLSGHAGRGSRKGLAGFHQSLHDTLAGLRNATRSPARPKSAVAAAPRSGNPFRPAHPTSFIATEGGQGRPHPFQPAARLASKTKEGTTPANARKPLPAAWGRMGCRQLPAGQR